MIAYNHYIKFIPKLKNDKKVEGSFSNIVTVQESTNSNINKKLLYELTFFNNQGRDLSLWTDREFARTQKGQLWTFSVKGVVTFFWYSGNLSLEYIKHDNFTENLLEYWTLHVILPIFFSIEETYDFLHAGAVEIDGNAVLFIADSCGGKSTMTDFFMKQGHTLISDDKVAVVENNRKFYAIPSHPHHRPHRGMEDLGFFVKNVAIEPKIINSIYELVKSNADMKITIEEIRGIDKFKSLRYASEMNMFFLREKRFKLLMDMANEISVYRVAVPWNINRIQEVYEVIYSHSKGI